VKQHALRHCNFCGKSERQIDVLIAGPSEAICNECVEQCVELIARHAPGEREYRSWFDGDPPP
jgi:ATP-dependent protease Clp ATPase subunit